MQLRLSSFMKYKVMQTKTSDSKIIILFLMNFTFNSLVFESYKLCLKTIATLTFKLSFYFIVNQLITCAKYL
jgi:hypothetical protein